MTKVNNEIYLRRAQKVILPKDASANKLPDAVIASMLKDIEQLGYTFSGNAIEALRSISETEIKAFHAGLVDMLNTLVGAHVQYKPMYPNFPKQVMSADEAELYINAMMHYFGDWIGARIMPEYEKESREVLTDNIKLKVVDLGEEVDFEAIFRNLASSKLSFSPTDKSDIEWFINNYKQEIKGLLPKEIPNKENLAVIANAVIKQTEDPFSIVGKYFKTATDVLRLTVALSDGDVSLATNTKIKSLPKTQRRMLLGLLEKSGPITEDMLRYGEQWKRAGERLHVGEYKKRFPKAYAAFEIIRNNKPFETFNHRVEGAVDQGDVDSAIELLKSRPGELGRRIDHLLRINSDNELVVKTFAKVAGDISTPVLLQLLAFYKDRNKPQDIRVFFPKGNVARAQAVKYDLPKLSEALREEVVAICKQALIQKFKQLPTLGKTYIDPKLKHYTVPFALRSASKAHKTVGRGSRLDLPNGEVIRFFIWWKDGNERTDLDLSAIGLDSDSNFKLQVSYTNLREQGIYHSGDITSAPAGASEFIDIEIEKIREFGVRYLIMTVNSFTQQPFYDLPECFAGFMVRQKPNSGEIYEPRTVENKFDLTADTKICLPLIADLQGKEVIWTDLAVRNRPSHRNNVLNHMSSLTLMNKAMMSLVKPTLYDLFSLHVEARGDQVETKQEAETVFSPSEGITPFQTEKIVGEYL